MAAHPIHYSGVDLSLRPGLRALKKRMRRKGEVTPDSLDRGSLESRERDLAFARDILAGFGTDSIVLREIDEALIRFRLEPREGRRLQHVIFARPCLQKLAEDPVRDVKVEYLRRDLERAALKKHTYVYPHSLWAILED